MVRATLLTVTLIAGFSLGRSLLLAESNPEFRPALVGNGPASLVNLIDEQKLLRDGKQDAVVMFSTFPPGGHLFGKEAILYNTSPNSQLLQKEVLRALRKAQLTPAIADHKQTPVFFEGTVMFFAKGTPIGATVHRTEFIYTRPYANSRP